MDLLSLLKWIASLVSGVVLAKGILTLVQLSEETRELYKRHHPEDDFVGLAE